jgi:hypothetical protein
MDDKTVIDSIVVPKTKINANNKSQTIALFNPDGTPFVATGGFW